MGCCSNRDIFMPIDVGEIVKSIVNDDSGCVADEESSIRADLGCLVDAVWFDGRSGCSGV